MNGRQRSRAASAPLPLLAGFGLFVATLVYLLVVSLTRRDAPVFTPSSAARVRPAHWMGVGDTLTLDATDGDRWRFASLTEGRPLTGADTARWQLAARRYRVTVTGGLADLGQVPFERARVSASTRFVPSRPGEMENRAMGHWYRYSLMTHLLTPNGHVYALRDRDGRLWKLQVLGYYCPRLIAGCLTLRYAPL
jgi:hypothetical protein